MTPEQFRASYGPTQAQVQQVQAYLASNGVQGLAVNTNGYLISGKANVKSLNAMLQTDIHQYKDANGKTYFSPSREPVLPKGLPIQAIHGLNNVTQRRHYAQQLVAEAKSAENRKWSQRRLCALGHPYGLQFSDLSEWIRTGAGAL